MHRILLLLVLFFLEKTVSAQYVYTIKADSVKITNSCDTAELIVENHTQNVPGFLFNKGRGRTEFRKGLVKLNDSLYRIGADTLKIPKPPVITASEGLSMVGNSVQLGHPTGTSGALTGNRSIPLNGKELRIADGTLVVQKQVTASNGSRLLYLNTNWNTTDFLQERPSALMISAWKNDSAIDGNLLSLHLYSSGRTPSTSSSFYIGSSGLRQQVSLYDYTSNNAFLNIMSGNITSANTVPYYGGGVITLNGIYGPTAGTGEVNGISDRSSYEPTGTGSDVSYSSFSCQPQVKTATTGKVRGIFYFLRVNELASIPANNNIAFENLNGNLLLNNQAGEAGGRTAIHRGIGNAPTAWLHLGAGLATANAAPLKFTSGTVLNAPEDGAIEYDGTELYLTTSSVRYSLSKTLKGQLTTNFGGASLAAWSSVTTILSIAGAQAGDVVNVSDNNGTVNPPSIIISAYVTAANTVTIRAYNASNTAVTIASDTYKVRVIK
jgi:hypothetical protein